MGRCVECEEANGVACLAIELRGRSVFGVVIVTSAFCQHAVSIGKGLKAYRLQQRTQGIASTSLGVPWAGVQNVR
jgi:hypothetical protein